MHKSDILIASVLDNGFDAGIVDLAQSHIERRRLGLDGSSQDAACCGKKRGRETDETHLARE